MVYCKQSAESGKMQHVDFLQYIKMIYEIK